MEGENIEGESVEDSIKKATLLKLEAEKEKLNAERDEITKRTNAKWFKGDNFWRNVIAAFLAIPILWAFATKYVLPTMETQKIAYELEKYKKEKEINILEKKSDSLKSISNFQRIRIDSMDILITHSEGKLDSLKGIIKKVTEENIDYRNSYKQLQLFVDNIIKKTKNIKTPTPESNSVCPFKNGKILSKTIKPSSLDMRVELTGDLKVYAVNNCTVVDMHQMFGRYYIMLKSNDTYYFYDNVIADTQTNYNSNFKTGEVIGSAYGEKQENEEQLFTGRYVFGFRVSRESNLPINVTEFLMCK